MRHDDAPLGSRAFENFYIWSTNELFLVGCPHVAVAGSKAFDDVWADVFIGEKRELERLHAVIFSSQVRSPLRTPAAYRNAAARFSEVS